MSGDAPLAYRGAVRTWRIIRFALFFAGEFIKSNLMVLREILSWRGRAAPAIVEVRLRSRSTVEMVSIANLITLTPGTLTVELADDPRTLYVHGMFVEDPDRFVADVLELEQRMLTAMRPVGQDRGW